MAHPQQFLLVEPKNSTPYPPLGLMRISSMLKKRHKNCQVFAQVGCAVPDGLVEPSQVFITSLFTWDFDSLVKTIKYYSSRFPSRVIKVGGVAASLLPDEVEQATGIRPHIGLLDEAEACPPDYDMCFGRKGDYSLTSTSRGCPCRCEFCCVNALEPTFSARPEWHKDIHLDHPRIVFWDNNWLASPNFADDCKTIRKLGKKVDFNQGLDAQLFTKNRVKQLEGIDIDPIRFAFDSQAMEKHVARAIELAKQTSNKEIRVYVLYNFEDSPEEFYYRIDVINKLGALAFPMEYRRPTTSKTRLPGPHWNTPLLRALKLSLLFYYRRGMITESRKAFLHIYGSSSLEFVDRLYNIYMKDKKLKRSKSAQSS